MALVGPLSVKGNVTAHNDILQNSVSVSNVPVVKPHPTLLG